MPGINAYEFVILIVLALVILGPERLPQYAQTLARWVRQLRGMAESAKEKFKDETGTDFDSVDWKKYDPRQYDPRRIIRDALTDDFGAEIGEVRGAIGSLGGSDPRRRSSSATSARASGAASGSQPGHGVDTRPAGGASAAGTAGAVQRSAQSADPRELFRSAQESRSSSSSPGPASSALAAGAAGALVSGAGAAEPSERGSAASRSRDVQDGPVGHDGSVPQGGPAPFDIDAT